MKRILPFVLLMFLVPAFEAQSERDEYAIGTTAAPKDYDEKVHKPKDYDSADDESKSYDAAKDTPKDFEATDDPPDYYDEANAKPDDFDEKTNKAQDYDDDYVEGIVYEPGGKDAYRERRR